MRYNPNPPYNVLATRDIDFATMQRFSRFARYWDLVGNSGHFRHSLPLLLGDAPFQRFWRLAEALHEHSGQTWKIALRRLFGLVHDSARTLAIDRAALRAALDADYAASPLKGRPPFAEPTPRKQDSPLLANRRQARHV